MKKYFGTITSMAAAATMVAAALATAVPASAAGSYDPTLTPRAKSAAKVAVASIATFRPAAAVKRTTRVATTRTGAARTAGTATASTASGGSELAEAKAILAGLIAAHPILRGTTVQFGDAHGYQAVAFYSSGRIVISRNHTASLKRILNHEVWHVIDYRDNGRIDWGENVPPK